MRKKHRENAEGGQSLTLDLDFRPKGDLSSWVRQSKKLALAYYTLTIQEMRLIWDLAARIRLTDNDFTEYEYSLSELHDIFGEHMTYADVEELLMRLYRRELHVESDSGVREALRWVISAVRDESQQTFRLALHPKLRTYFIGLQEWVMTEKATLRAFSSEYAVRLYIMACVYRNQDIQTWQISIAELRARLGITADQYTRFSNLKSRVLDAPIRELNERAAPFELGFRVDKRGYTPTSIFFELKNWTRTKTGTGAKVAARIEDRRQKMNRKARAAKKAESAASASAATEPVATDEQRAAVKDKSMAEFRESVANIQDTPLSRPKLAKAKSRQWTAEDVARETERKEMLRQQWELISANDAGSPQ